MMQPKWPKTLEITTPAKTAETNDGSRRFISDMPIREGARISPVQKFVAEHALENYVAAYQRAVLGESEAMKDHRWNELRGKINTCMGRNKDGMVLAALAPYRVYLTDNALVMQQAAEALPPMVQQASAICHQIDDMFGDSPKRQEYIAAFSNAAGPKVVKAVTDMITGKMQEWRISSEQQEEYLAYLRGKAQRRSAPDATQDDLATWDAAAEKLPFMVVWDEKVKANSELQKAADELVQKFGAAKLRERQILRNALKKQMQLAGIEHAQAKELHDHWVSEAECAAADAARKGGGGRG